ncbi:hypothetical protein [Lentzea californiensis]|uniref:hypothetical protein n=1 Tax=Lentzea californiensis TaxID=438851 RepID=UPI002165A14D|nr:hypothetical protein [Lentzea californiensis]
MAITDPLPEVQSAATLALLSNRGDEAIQEFLTAGYPAAKERAAKRIDLDLKYIRHINRFAIPGSNVQVTSANALRGTPAMQSRYVQSGYDEAQELDRVNDNRRDERLARLHGEDRDYVTYLAANDPGVQVRDAANRALSAGTDEAIGLFFKYYWGIGADLDNEGFRQRTLEQNEFWLRKIRVLVDAAQAAEKAERESSGELARKARLDAIAHWDLADAEAKKSSVDWNAEKDKADEQADFWASVAAHARAAMSEQDWAAVLARADASNTSWEDEAAWAQSQAATWLALAADAKRNADAGRDRDQGDQ